ncbi:hydrogen peroxide-inducible genes activator [Roseovarius faecimaris]|uniref:Hydrogen peroxide-inducible genes activator n=1 Tax=Roseovarius faecimaris TaxID=2494550 RepID=A0A6I6INQ9_9RHOB|nr:hydrogen peroxide-inducible genes activator [Roseovarius faecimaris]QGX97734.1 hydrogen peroxide-inducible genes activator [Roseovarius faecimaris]
MADELTLKQLRYFMALAETHHYRRAAERAGVSQPSLSQQIVALEGALGLELVERGRRGAVLTPAGREVRLRAQAILDDVAALEAMSGEMRKGEGGTIRLGSTPTLGPYLLPYVVRRLKLSYPGLKLVIRDAAPRQLQEELVEGRHDLILTQLPVQSGDVEVERLFREPLKLAVAADHPLADREHIREADLKGQDILSLSDAYLLHSQTVQLCAELGAHLRQDYEGTSLDALRQMTALNMGVSFLPALYVRSEVARGKGDVVIHAFRKDGFTRSIGLAWRKRSAHGALIVRIGAMIREVVRAQFAQLVVEEGQG